MVSAIDRHLPCFWAYDINARSYVCPHGVMVTELFVVRANDISWHWLAAKHAEEAVFDDS